MDLTLISAIGDGSQLSRSMRTNHAKEYDQLVSMGIIVPTMLMQYGGTGRALHNDIVKRPGLDPFLSFCRAMFSRVILWSAGQPGYVYDTVKNVLDPDNKGLFDHVYTLNDVVGKQVPIWLSKEIMRTGDADMFNSIVRTSSTHSTELHHTADYGVHNIYTKPLSRIATRFPDVTMEKTVIVDDLATNFIPNPRNGILIPPFDPRLGDLLGRVSPHGTVCGDMNVLCDDLYLYRLMHFFADDTFINAKDVRDYDLHFFPNTLGMRGI